MEHYYFWYYVVIINLLSGLVFTVDKRAAIHRRRRVPERTLHLLEMLGGVFANLLLMYALPHKNRKSSYWVWTWLVLIGWGVVFFYFIEKIEFVNNL